MAKSRCARAGMDEPGISSGSQTQRSSQDHSRGVERGQERIPPPKEETTGSSLKGKLQWLGTHQEYLHLQVHDDTCKNSLVSFWGG